MSPTTSCKPLIDGIDADPFFTTFPSDAGGGGVGIVCRRLAWRACAASCLMQTSGFATLPNVLASLPCAFQIPVLMMVSERGTLGEFNMGQAMVCRTMRPILDSLGMEHHTVLAPRRVRALSSTAPSARPSSPRRPAALILSPLLTGGKAVARGATSA